MNLRMLHFSGWLFAALMMPMAAHAQSGFAGSFADFSNDMGWRQFSDGLMGTNQGIPGSVERMADADIENRNARRDVRDAENSAGRGAIDMGTALAGWGINTAQSASEFLKNWRSLSDTDDRCTLADPGPQIPSSCGEPGSKCYTCYERATSSLNFNRRNLHRAWCVTHTNLTMAKSAIGFGDSSSGVHGVVGLSWSLGGKPQIEQAMNDLRRTYDRKQEQFITAIDGNLQALGKCEAEHFDEQDWYTRFGYMYLDHLRVRYKSAEP
jgi:hypothetical protein